MSQPLARRYWNARLVHVQLPGMKIKDDSHALAVEAAQAPLDYPVGEHAIVEAAGDGNVAT